MIASKTHKDSFSSHPYKGCEVTEGTIFLTLDTSTEGTEVTEVMLRHKLLDEYRVKQPFRVSVGKSKWVQYETFDEKYNLREILNDEIVIEFDCDDLEIVMRAVGQTGINLARAGYAFEYWNHKGKSPHLHIHNLPIKNLDDSKRALFKKLFIRKYVPLEYLPYVDYSLTGIHLIAIEWAFHWKGKYDVKKLIWKYEGGKFED